MSQLPFFIGFIFLFSLFASCNQTRDKAPGVDPGPVTETDRQRYNLNSNDVRVYDSLDSTGKGIDSINRDSSNDMRN